MSKELADRVVAILGGIVVEMPHSGHVVMDTIQEGHWMGVEPFVRDWRVAGALMEKLWERDLELYSAYDHVAVCIDNQTTIYRAYGEPPQCIIEACVEALENE